MPCSRSVPVRSRKASSIDSGSTSGVSANIALRTSRPTSTYFAMFGLITTACGQRRLRLEHRHRRADAVGARDVAAGGDDAAFAAADDHRLVGERGVVALFDRGVEGVAVDMRDGQRCRVSAWRASRGEPQAGQRAACPDVSARQSRQKPAHGTLALPRLRRRALARALPTSAGLEAGLGGEGGEQPFVGGEVVEHAGQKARLARGGANLGRADAG